MIKYKTIKKRRRGRESQTEKKLLAVISSFSHLKASSSVLEAKEIYFIILIVC